MSRQTRLGGYRARAGSKARPEALPRLSEPCVDHGICNCSVRLVENAFDPSSNLRRGFGLRLPDWRQYP